MDDDAGEVLSAYPHPCRGPREPVGTPGFSGARVWRVASAVGPLCLRAWPADMGLERLAEIHRLMRTAREAGLCFVPALLVGPEGRTWVERGHTLWELQEWLPGMADYHDRPSEGRLREACRALALVHGAWEGGARRGLVSAVQRRRERLEQWQRLARGRRGPGRGGEPLLGRAWDMLLCWGERVAAWLVPWERWEGRTHPCLCDPWHDHLLFSGDRLTGLIDYGEVKRDGPSVDLARLLGSLAADDLRGWQVGLSAYREVRTLTPEEERLARVLDLSGTVLGLASWVRWLGLEGRTFASRERALARLGTLVRRVEGWGADVAGG